MLRDDKLFLELISCNPLFSINLKSSKNYARIRKFKVNFNLIAITILAGMSQIEISFIMRPDEEAVYRTYLVKHEFTLGCKLSGCTVVV
jgi:hypothetical protein